MSAPAAAPIETPAPTPTPRPGRPAWQRNPWFKFFASVKLAVVLLSVLIVASVAGTLYETTFDAKVARAYIYNAWWFNGWLVVLCLNLACAAFSRMPWKRHHTGFLITHLGIIVLMIGAMIGRAWGIEGTMTLFRGQPPNNQLVIDRHVLRVEDPPGAGSAQQFPVEIIGRAPTPGRPWKLGRTASGWDITLVDYAPIIDATFEPRAVPSGTAGGQPAVRVKLVSKRLNQSMDHWLLAGDPEHGALDLGLASVQLRAGTAPETSASSAPAAPAPAAGTVDERVVVFALRPEQSVAGGAPAGSKPSGATVRLAADAATGKKTVFVDWRGATWTFDAADLGNPQDLSGSGLHVTVENYWPDFVMNDGQPATASNQDRNPAALVRVHGNLPAPTADDPADAPPAAGGGMSGASNQAIIYCDEKGALTFTLKSSAAPAPVRGTLEPGQPVGTGWGMDWQLEAVNAIPSAAPRTTFHPVRGVVDTGSGKGGNMSGQAAGGNRGEGVLVHLTKGAQRHEQWVAAGWQITMPTTPQPTRLAYDFEIAGLPIGLQLEKFEVGFNEGTDTPSSFASHLKVTDMDGGEGRGSCSMNQPFNYPGYWWNTVSGLTFKMSQAQWNPADLNQSSVQILRDPGWLFKWIGSLLICLGIFTMFYLRPAPNPARSNP